MNSSIEPSRNIPKLRFPEFEGEWHNVLLEDIAQRGSGHTPNKNHPEYYNGNIPWVSLADSNKLDEGYIENTKTKITIDGIKHSSAVLHPKESVILSRDAGIGKSAVLKYEMAVSQHFIVWLGKNGQLDNWFLYYKLQILKPEFERIAIGNTIKTIGLPYFKKLRFFLPLLKEQQKIATFLRTLDEKLTALKQKKNLLEQYKKGVMQKLFSQELRFKDENGKDFPKWEKKMLGDVLIEENEKTKMSGQHRILSSTAKGLFNQDEYFTRDIASKDNTGYKILRKFQLVFSPQNLWLGNINVNMAFDIGIVSPSYKTFSFNQNHTSAQYCQYFLLLPQMMFEYEQSSVQGASVVRRNLDMDRFLKIKIHLPCNEEQTKIASFLSAIDEKINRTENQIQQTQEYKKGLLQNMFI